MTQQTPSPQQPSEALIQAYLEDDLSPQECRELLALLKNEKSLGERLLNELAMDELLHTVVPMEAAGEIANLSNATDKPTLARSRTAEATSNRSNGSHASRRKQTRKKSSSRQKTKRSIPSWAWALAACLFVLLAANMVRNTQSNNDRLVVASLSQGACRLQSSQKSTSRKIKAGAKIRIGDTLVTDSNSDKVQMEYPDGTVIQLSPNSKLMLQTAKKTKETSSLRGKRLVLKQGTLQAEVTPQPTARPMLISTDTATVRVLGTRFKLTTHSEQTMLQVESGRVELTRTADQTSVEVTTGKRVVATSDAKLALTLTDIPAERNFALRPFSDDSPWNRPIPPGLSYNPITSSALTGTAGAELNTRKYTHPIFIAVTTDSKQTITAPNMKQPLILRIPKNAQPDRGGIGIIHIIEPTHHWVYEMAGAKRLPNGDVSAGEVFKVDLRGSGFVSPTQNIRVSGASCIGGLIRKGELKTGFQHAIAVSVLLKAINRNAPGGKAFISPATTAPKRPRFGQTGNLFLGSRLAIPANVDLSTLDIGASGPAYELARALQTYGAYIVETFDSGRNRFTFFAEPIVAREIDKRFQQRLSRIVKHLEVVTAR